MKNQHLIIALLLSISCFAAGFWLGPQYANRPNPYLVAMRASDPVLYRSKQESEGIVLDGDAGRVREALLNTDLLVRSAELSSVLLELGPDSIDEVRKAFDSVFLDIGDTELVLFAEWWARLDPHAAMDWSESDWRADHRVIAMQILRAWGRIDPQAALVRAERGRGVEKQDKDSYILAAIAGWEQSDPLAVLTYLQAMNAGVDRQRMMRGFARRRVLRYGIDGAFSFISALPDTDELFKLNLMRRVVSAAVKIDAPKTAALAATLQGGPYFESLPQRVAIPWSRKDPHATVEWLGSLEDSDTRDDGVREAYRTWSAYDRDGAIEWVTGTEHEPWRDHALALHARHTMLADFEKGVAAAEMIFDPELRQGTLTIITRVWATYDREAATSYVEEAGWTEKERKRALAVEAQKAKDWRKRAWETGELEKKEGIHPKQVREKMERDLVEADFADPESAEDEDQDSASTGPEKQ